MGTMISVIYVLLGIILILTFLIYCVSGLIENIRFKKNMMQVYVSEWDIKIIHKKDYYKYVKIDKEIREQHKRYDDWFDNLDSDRKSVYLLERGGVYYSFELRGNYINDYIQGKIDKEQFNKSLIEELDSEEYNKRVKKKQLLQKKDEIRKQLLQRKIEEKSREHAKLRNEYSRL